MQRVTGGGAAHDPAGAGAGAETAAAARLAVLRDLSVRLAQHGEELQTALEIVARTVAEAVGGAGAVWLLTSDGTRLEARAWWHRDAAGRDALDGALPGWSVPAVGESSARMLRGRGTVFVEQVDEERFAASVPAELQDYLRRIGCTSFVRVPLVARGRTLGVLTAARNRGQAPLTSADAAFVEEVAGRASAGIDTARLLDEAARHSRVVDSLVDSVISIDVDRIVRSWNSAAERLYGVDAGEAVGRPVDDLLPSEIADTPGDVARRAARRKVLQEGRWQGHLRTRVGDREIVTFSTITLLQDEDGTPAGTVAVSREVTPVSGAAPPAGGHERLAQGLLDALPNQTAVIDAAGTIVGVNTGWSEFARDNGADAAKVGIGANYLDVLRDAAGGDSQAAEALAGIEAVVAGRLPSFQHNYAADAPGGQRWYRLHVVPLTPSRDRFLVSHVDVTWNTVLERQLHHRSTHDMVTGLPNRTLVVDRIEHALVRAQRAGTPVGVLLCDLDDFKVVNDTLGHAVGDRLLIEATHRIVAVARAADTVGRFGGDEFVIVLEELADVAEAVAVARRVITELNGPVQLAGHEVYVAASAGLALWHPGQDPGERPGALELVRDADIAMYRAKARGRGRIELFDHTMRTAVNSRFELRGALQRALERREFRLVYQPIFATRDGGLAGVEALLRWEHPERGTVMPGEFVLAAEESGAVVPIGAWVLEEACRRAARWRSSAPPGFTVSVNLSARQLAEPDLVTLVGDAVRRHRLEPTTLTLEITETALAEDPQTATAALSRLRALGVRVALDDFGTGYSSLAHLRHFPVDSLKVDRSFVRDAPTDPQSAALVGAVAALARSLGLLCVAEGVETPEQLEAVRSAGCDHYQGFLHGIPVDPARLAPLLRRGRAPAH